MHQQVVAAWRGFTEPLEGYVQCMYPDIKGLITTGCGNLIDPKPAAMGLPWKHGPAGALATQAEISAAWDAVKAFGRGWKQPMHWKYAAKLTDLRLDNSDIDRLVTSKLLENEAYLRRTFTRWDVFPADAQLGILSMAWAVGPGFTRIFGNFTAAALAENWDGCVAACAIRTDGNPGVVPRNARNRLCFANAALVKRAGADVSQLHWPEAYTGPTADEHADAAFAASEAKRHNDEAMDKFVRDEFERVRQGFSAGAAIREYEET